MSNEELLAKLEKLFPSLLGEVDQTDEAIICELAAWHAELGGKRTQYSMSIPYSLSDLYALTPLENTRKFESFARERGLLNNFQGFGQFKFELDMDESSADQPWLYIVFERVVKG